MKIDKLDPNFARKEAGDDLLWYDIRELGVEGRGWTDTEAFYDRLPARAKPLVRGPVWDLSKQSAGLCVRFISDAPSIAASWKLLSGNLAMLHMPALGVSGLDLYVELNRAWRWMGSAQPATFPDNKATVAYLPKMRKRHFLLYLPLYNGVESVSIGIPKNAVIAQAPPYPRKTKPVVFYGTSIVQGGCASRPGLAYTSIIGRRLRRPVINLGFSGNGPMEMELARLIAEVDAAAYVIDCLPNIRDEALVTERTEPFVRILREARPRTPIILVENIVYQNSLPEDPQPRHARMNKAFRAAFLRLKADHVPALTYVRGEHLLGGDWEATVDGTHPNDIGFMRMADALTPVLKPLV